MLSVLAYALGLSLLVAFPFAFPFMGILEDMLLFAMAPGPSAGDGAEESHAASCKESFLCWRSFWYCSLAAELMAAVFAADDFLEDGFFLRTFFFFDVVGFCSATLAGLGEFVRKGSVIFVNDRVDRALDMFENTCCNKDKQVVNTMSAECTYLPITFYLLPAFYIAHKHRLRLSGLRTDYGSLRLACSIT